MTTLLELVLECIGGLAEWFCSWRFLVCVAGTFVLVAGICHLISNDSVRIILSLPIIATGVITGLAWEFRCA
jgi:hypothetical protein